MIRAALFLLVLFTLPRTLQAQAPAPTPERWFVVMYGGGGSAPQFEVPFRSLDGCEKKLERIRQSGRSLVEAVRRSEGRETLYVMRLRRELQSLELSSLCERR